MSGQQAPVHHALNWFEVPVEDFDRAKKFYEAIFDYEMYVQDFSDTKMGFFPTDKDRPMEAVHGAIVLQSDMKPADRGTTVYLNGGGDLSVILDRVEGAGGTVCMPKFALPDPAPGFIGMFIDSEGNKVGLHSMG